jgi:uncharacterized protein DUF262
MSRQTPQPLTRLRTTAALWQIDEYTDRIRRGEMLLDPPYQRGPRWTTSQRIDLMRSWLQGAPIPAIVLNERFHTVWQRTDPQMLVNYAVVDGRQRLETALAWQDGSLAIPASWLPPDQIHTVDRTEDGPYVRSTGLHLPRKVTRVMELPCVRAQVGTVAAEAALYLLVNGSGTSQSVRDLARAAAVAAT